MKEGGDDQGVLGQLMLAFDGTTLPEPMRHRLLERPAAGVTLFRHANVNAPAQLRELTDAIQSLAPVDLPFLIAIDQEGGQLAGLGAASISSFGTPRNAWRIRKMLNALARLGTMIDQSVSWYWKTRTARM